MARHYERDRADTPKAVAGQRRCLAHPHDEGWLGEQLEQGVHNKPDATPERQAQRDDNWSRYVERQPIVSLVAVETGSSLVDRGRHVFVSGKHCRPLNSDGPVKRSLSNPGERA